AKLAPMNRLAAKEKRRSSGRSRSYPKTRVRASRLQNAARILAFIELSRRLHQAYRQAYDKQAADRLLPQNTFSQSSSSPDNTDPCARFLPANVPANVSVDKNIALAETLYNNWSLKGQSEPGSRGASASMLNYIRPQWFKEQTGDHGPMDYKYLTTDMRYDDFGNFNYGAVGAAIRYSGDTLLRVAGWIQQRGNYAYLGEGTPPSSFLDALSGVGGTYPYGDKPGDAVQIQNGVDYYNCRKEHPLK